MEQLPEIILASSSPRRKELLRAMGLEFSVMRVDVEESFPEELAPGKAVMFLAEKKARAYTGDRGKLLITADTLVYLQGEFLGKPADEAEARALLERLSGNIHEVFTGVSLTLGERTMSFYERTEVEFGVLHPGEIDYYLHKYQPLDKAGAYGIQEWIGWIGVLSIRGSFSNVMGLPTALLHKKLETFLGKSPIFVKQASV